MLFLTSELANEAEITILSARDTRRAWVPGRGIMGRNVGVYKNEYNTWFPSRLQNNTTPTNDVEVIFKDFKYFLNKHLSSIKNEIPGTTDVFRKLKSAGMKIAVGSGFPQSVVEAIVSTLNCRKGGPW